MSMNNDEETPGQLEHPVFGVLRYDAPSELYMGSFSLGDETCEVTFDKSAQMDHALAQAALFVQREGWRALLKAMLPELTELKNEFWLEDDEDELSETDLGARLRLSALGFNAKGGCEAEFDDDDLFWGHTVVAMCDEKGVYQGMELAG